MYTTNKNFKRIKNIMINYAVLSLSAQMMVENVQTVIFFFMKLLATKKSVLILL